VESRFLSSISKPKTNDKIDSSLSRDQVVRRLSMSGALPSHLSHKNSYSSQNRSALLAGTHSSSSSRHNAQTSMNLLHTPIAMHAANSHPVGGTKTSNPCSPDPIVPSSTTPFRGAYFQSVGGVSAPHVPPSGPVSTVSASAILLGTPGAAKSAGETCHIGSTHTCVVYQIPFTASDMSKCR
jgi:hypothetical protein